MNSSPIFSLVSTIAAIQWSILIVLPKWKITKWLIAYAAIPIFFSLLYAFFIVGFFNLPGAGFGSIAKVRTLFSNDNLLLAGWIHYLAFDLLIGFHILKSAQSNAIAHLLVIPCLILTFMFGPCGYLLYQVIFKLNLKK